MLHQEFYRVSAGATSEAVKKSSLGVHVEGGRLLGMKWTKPLERRPGFFQGCPMGTDQTDYVCSFRNPANEIFTERHELLKQGHY